jgi:aspartate aminotransferase
VRSGAKVYYLNIGQPDLPTPDIVMDRIRSYPGKYVPYSPSAGIPEFQKGMAAYYAQHGLSVAPGEVLTTVGGSEALQFAFWALFNPGDEVILFEPFYTNYATMALLAGVGVKALTCDGRTGYHLPPIEAIERAVGPKTRGILVCAPSNPTGTAYTAAEIDAIVALANRKDLWIITDEAYREFIYDGAKCESPMTRKGAEERTVLVDSISKRLNMCGARVGALVTKNAAVRDACLKFAQARLSPPTLGQYAAAVIDQCRLVHPGRRGRPETARPCSRGCRAPRRVRANRRAPYLMAELPVPDAEGVRDLDAEGVPEEQRDRHGGARRRFYATPGRGRTIASRARDGRAEPAMEILAGALEAYPVKAAK